MRPTLLFGLLAAIAPGLLTNAQPASAQATLQQVKARGEVLCGSNPGLAGFALADAQGTLRGLDADTCRAVAAAVLGDATKVRFVPLATPALALNALRDGRVDLVARNLTQTMSCDADFGLSPAGITYYDGQVTTARASWCRWPHRSPIWLGWTASASALRPGPQTIWRWPMRRGASAFG